eukprot:COSAG02_NODE_7100_length_3185_cov_3.158782_1_plen_377_part_00
MSPPTDAAVANTAFRQEATAKAAAAPVVDIETARTQLRAALGARPGFGKSDRMPTWWPDAVPWRQDYSLGKISKKDLGVVHSAFCKHQGLAVQRVVSIKAAAKAAAAITAPTAVGDRATGVRYATSDPTVARDCTVQVANVASEDRELESVGLKRGRDRSLPPPIPSRYKAKRSGRDGGNNVTRSDGSNSSQEEMATADALGSSARSSTHRPIPPCIPTRPRSWQAQCRGVSGSRVPAAVLHHTDRSTSAQSAEGQVASTAEAMVVVLAGGSGGATAAARGAGAGRAGVGGGVGAEETLPQPARETAASVGGDMAPPAARKPRRQRAYTSFLSLRSEEQALSEGRQVVVSADQDARANPAKVAKGAPSKPTGQLTI